MSRRMDSSLAHECRYKGLAAYGHAHRPLGCTSLFFLFPPTAANAGFTAATATRYG
jgi:hypothetical protein